MPLSKAATSGVQPSDSPGFSSGMELEDAQEPEARLGQEGNFPQKSSSAVELATLLRPVLPAGS